MVVGLSAVNLANAWLDMLEATAFTAPTATWVELHTADPGAAGTTAVSVGSTTRLQVTSGNWNAAASGSKSISATVGPWTNGGTSETLSHIAVFSASTAGTFWFSAALTSSQAWASTNTFSLTALTVAFTPIAA